MTDVLAAVRAHVAAFNARDVEAVLAGFSDDAVFSTGDEMFVGRASLRQLFVGAFALPAALELELLRSVVQDDTAACELRELITAGGVTQELLLAGFYTVRGERIVRVKVYREGTAEPPG